VLPLLQHLKTLGLNPKAFTLDGHRLVIQALLEVWPNLIIQRCLFHIERQGLQWLRSFPKLQASQDLRIVLKSTGAMKTKQDMYSFLANYTQWRNKYYQIVHLLPRTSSVNKDIKRTMALIDNALKDMFHFVKDRNILPTTNYLENFFAQLKHRYRGHKGLSPEHRVAYLKWYCYYKNNQN
jgi:transposase-like protein